MGINQLKQEFSQGRLALAYSIESDDLDYAQTQLLRVLSQTIYQKYHQSDDLPDTKIVSRLPDKKDIGVSQVRDISKFLSQSSVISGSKVAIINGGQYLNDNSSNALLKLMEDSPKGNHVFILTNNHRALLPTIISRCRHIKDDSTKNESSSQNHKPLEILLQLQDSSADIASIISEVKSSGDDIWQETSEFAQELLCRISQYKAGTKIDFSQNEQLLIKGFQQLSLDATIMVYEKLTSFVDKVHKYDLPKMQSLVLLSEYFNLEHDQATI